MPGVVRVAAHVHRLATHSCLTVRASRERVRVCACLFGCKHGRVGATPRHNRHGGFDLEAWKQWQKKEPFNWIHVTQSNQSARNEKMTLRLHAP